MEALRIEPLYLGFDPLPNAASVALYRWLLRINCETASFKWHRAHPYTPF
jgi:hypothetical protein